MKKKIKFECFLLLLAIFIGTRAFPCIFFILVILEVQPSSILVFVSFCSKSIIKTPERRQLTSLFTFLILKRCHVFFYHLRY